MIHFKCFRKRRTYLKKTNFLPFISWIRKFPPNRYEIANILIEGILFPSFRDSLPRIIAQVLRQYDRFAKLTGGIDRPRSSYHTKACRMYAISTGLNTHAMKNGCALHCHWIYYHFYHLQQNRTQQFFSLIL